jgi:SpoVK/Ycf46/Vps4 family AAA+-type ATPase
VRRLGWPHQGQLTAAVVVAVVGRMVWKKTRTENVAAGGWEAPWGCACHIAVIRQRSSCLSTSATILSSLAVVAATLVVTLDGMEGGRGARFKWERVIVVAVTNQVDAIPSYLWRPGRLEREVLVRPPDLGGRYKLYPAAAADGNKCNECEDKVGLQEVADTCVGYVVADLSALVQRAATLGAGRAPEWAGPTDRFCCRPGITVFLPL